MLRKTKNNLMAQSLGLLCLFLLSTQAQAQTVVLINQIPTTVIIENGEIVELVPSNLNSYLNDYDTAVPDTYTIPLAPLEALQPTVASMDEPKKALLLLASNDNNVE